MKKSELRAHATPQEKVSLFYAVFPVVYLRDISKECVDTRDEWSHGDVGVVFLTVSGKLSVPKTLFISSPYDALFLAKIVCALGSPDEYEQYLENAQRKSKDRIDYESLYS